MEEREEHLSSPSSLIFPSKSLIQSTNKKVMKLANIRKKPQFYEIRQHNHVLAHTHTETETGKFKIYNSQ